MSVTIRIPNWTSTATVFCGKWTSNDPKLVALVELMTYGMERNGDDPWYDYTLAKVAIKKLRGEIISAEQIVEYNDDPYADTSFRLY